MGIDHVPRIVIVGKWQAASMQLDICRLEGARNQGVGQWILVLFCHNGRVSSISTVIIWLSSQKLPPGVHTRYNPQTQG